MSVSARAGLRRGLVAASGDLPLAWLLSALAGMSRFVDVDRLPAAQAAADAFGLRGAARTTLCRRAWWGAKAAEVIESRLRRRPADVLGALAAADLGAIDRARQSGRGVLLAGAHLGPDRVAATVVRDRFPDALFLLNEPWRGPGSANLLRVDEDANRGAALVEARRHLRRGGLVYLAPDGISGPLDVRVPLRGGHVPMGQGAAALARLASAPAFPVVAAWVDRRIRILVGDALAPAPAEDWLAEYVRQLDRWSSDLPPENLRLYGSIYARWIRGSSIDTDDADR